jgi:L-seryl-tRNA(Ser) seleniumtransferase
LRDALASAVGTDFAARVADCVSQVGSGALPLETLPSAGIAIRPRARKEAGRRLAALAKAFRNLPVPVIGRIEDNALVLDMRCMDDEGGFLTQLPELCILVGSDEEPDVPA